MNRTIHQWSLKSTQVLKQFSFSTLLRRQEQGFALPLAMGLGFVMVILGMSIMIVAQGDRISAFNRKESGASLALAGGMARTLAQLTALNNAVLLNRNYDTINSKTGKTYLGPDGMLNSGDEDSNPIDEWTGYDPSGMPCHQQKNWGSPNFAKTGSIGTTGTYTVRAYRFNSREQKGTLFVEASKDGKTTGVLITIAVQPDLDDFPSLILHDPSPNLPHVGTLALRGRHILGSKGNVYYNLQASPDPTMTASSSPTDVDREAYLNAVFSSAASDGATGDTVSGKLFACLLTPTIPNGIKGTNFGTITTSQTLSGVGGTTPTLYQIETVDLAGSDVLTIDTTNGPVVVDFVKNSAPGQSIRLKDSAKILNIRTDGQPPRVGDLRMHLRGGEDTVVLYDQTCIQNAFIWLARDEVRLLTSGPGCPGGQNTNIEGVVWAEGILSSKNAASNRDVKFRGKVGEPYDTVITPNATSGIAIPEDVSSLIDTLKYVDWPARYRFGGVQQWQRVRLE